MGHQLVSDPEPVASPSELSFQPLTCEVKRSCGNAQGSTEPFPCPPWYLRKRRGDPAALRQAGGSPWDQSASASPAGTLSLGTCQGRPPPPLTSLAVCFPPRCLFASSLSLCICVSLHLWLCLSLPPPPTLLILNYSTPAYSSACPFPAKPVLCPLPWDFSQLHSAPLRTPIPAF